jgi:hypothetical protein
MFFLICIYLLSSIYSQEDCVGKTKENCIDDCYFLPLNEDSSEGSCITDLCVEFLKQATSNTSISFFEKMICEQLEFCEVFFFFFDFFFVVYW